MNSRKKPEMASNRSIKNPLILTSMDNSINAKGKENILPYEYNKNNSKFSAYNSNIFIKRKKNTRLIKSFKHKSPDTTKINFYKISSTINSDKNLNKKPKKFLTTSLHNSRKNSRGLTEKKRQKEKTENLLQKIKILNFKQLFKPYSYRLANGGCSFKACRPQQQNKNKENKNSQSKTI